MFAQHPGNQGKEGGVDREEERKKRKENHIAAKSASVSSTLSPFYDVGKINVIIITALTGH